MESLYAGSRHRIQILQEVPAKSLQPQSTKHWTVTEVVFASLQLLLIARYPAIVRLGSVLHPCQRSNLLPANQVIGLLQQMLE